MNRRSEVLEALRTAGAAGVSGEVLAESLGVSRAAVAKHVRALRTLGYRIEAVVGAGYTLLGVPDLAIPTEIEPLVSDPLWVSFTGGLETTSTNDDAKELARAGSPEGSVLAVARQSAGRGRLGRSWTSPEGGVYLSVLLRPRAALADLAPLPLVVALGVARGLQKTGVRPTLKWPNDVMLSGRKVAGILLEMSAESDRVEWVVAGVGLNVLETPAGVDRVARIAEETPDATPAVVGAAVLDGIASAYREFADEGFGRLLAEYESRSELAGREVTVSDVSGAVRATGRVVGIDLDGRLLLDGPTGRDVVSAGDVTLRGPASKGRPGGAGGAYDA